MADLESVIRFRKYGVDEKRRFLTQLYREAEVVEKQKKIILDQMQKETDMANHLATVEARAYLGLYLEGARKKVRALEGALRKMDVRIAAAQEDIREAFNEMKKVEITQANRDKREEAALKKKEDQSMDDMAIEAFLRRQQDE